MEIGWFDVVLSDEAKKYQLFKEFPARFSGFHWHGDTFASPPGTQPLMSSEACESQAFLLDGGRVLGLQFHLEVGAADAASWLREDPPPPGRYVQSPAEILREPARFAENHRLLRLLLDRMAQ
jgi:GMP synthase-like glutamine amidotransferase